MNELARSLTRLENNSKWVESEIARKYGSLMMRDSEGCDYHLSDQKDRRQDSGKFRTH